MQISARQIAGMCDGPAFLVSLILFSLSLVWCLRLYQASANATPRLVRISIRVGPHRDPDTELVEEEVQSQERVLIISFLAYDVFAFG